MFNGFKFNGLIAKLLEAPNTVATVTFNYTPCGILNLDGVLSLFIC